MPEQTRPTLKGYFETGDIPTQSQFVDLIDSHALVAEVALKANIASPVFTGPVTCNADLIVGGGLQAGYVAKTALYTLAATDYVVNCTSGTFALTLETAVGCAGRIHILKNSGAGVITINTTSAQTVDGSASGAITLNQYDAYTVQSNGANWIII